MSENEIEPNEQEIRQIKRDINLIVKSVLGVALIIIVFVLIGSLI